MLRKALITAAVGAIILSGTAVPQAHATHPDPYPGCPSVMNIHKRNNSACVVQWQQVLKAFGLYNDRVDGSFGNNTHTATVKFQNQYLHVTPDGSVGRQTNVALCGLPRQNGYVDQVESIINRNPHAPIWDARYRAIATYCWE